MKESELNQILENHKHYLNRDCENWESMKANLRCVNLKGADLSNAILIGADLHDAYLVEANLSGANLSCANLGGAILVCANLSGANLSGAILFCANLRSANLSCSDLHDAYLAEANLSCANLDGANLNDVILNGANLNETNFDKKERCRSGVILKEPMLGYKKVYNGDRSEHHIITFEIPKGAIVFSINNNKCRTNKAKVIDMDGQEELYASYDKTFAYHLNDDIEIEDFNLTYNLECASGIHFFRTKEEAENFNK